MDVNGLSMLVGGMPTPLKNVTSSLGVMNFPYGKHLRHVLATTNQLLTHNAQDAEML